jgi:hypothetical protein
LPQESGKLYVTDGGCETWMFFHEGFNLPVFANWTILHQEGGG